MPNKLDVDPNLIRRLAALLQETGLAELEVALGDQRVRVRRPEAQNGVVVAGTAPAAAGAGGAPPAASVPAGAVTSPMVGTVYIAPEPGAAPFVSVGDKVQAGQTLMIVEAMKVMNPIPAPRAGTVTRILVRDRQPVEFGEPLLILD
ncbi:MAG: acetyl-CoA carboxylase biotin carboxyl carrier protein [Alphaproteobacteria bacterium]|nr:acetyl-CoA carboxylase biotin carboxyl carrier protein [Alphaproteobacteria bacterium]